MNSARKESILSKRIIEFDNHFDEAVLIDRNGKQKLFSNLNKRFKKNICYVKTDKSEKRSFVKQCMPGLKRLNNFNVNPISKKKHYKSHNRSDENVFECYKSLNENNISTYNQNLHNGNNIKVQETENMEEETKQLNFNPCISKVIEELKRILSNFIMQINNLHLKHLGNEVLNQGDAEDMVFIIGCIISKLKEELCDQENVLTKSYLQQTLKYNFEQSCSHKSANPNKNTSQLQTRLSLHEESLDNITVANNNKNNYIPVEIKSQKHEGNLSIGSSTIATAVIEINNKIDSWNKQNKNFNNLKEIDVTRTSIKKPRNIFKSLHDNNLEITKTNWKSPTEIETTVTIEPTVTDQHPIKTKKDLLEKRPTSMEIQSAESDYGNDQVSICSTINLISEEDDLSQDYREHFCDSHNTITEFETENLRSYNSEETLIIPNNKKSTTCKENLNVNDTYGNIEIDEAVSMSSSTSSLYMIPSFSQDVENTNRVNINPSVRKHKDIVDKKLFMICTVELEKLKSISKTVR
nr:formin-J-like [Megalopta genalis]